jgi:rhodanese-related sulfurtransferase/CBS domain-containing protein
MKDTLTLVSPRLPALRSHSRPTPVAVGREDVQHLLDRGAQTVDVRSAASHAAAHLPGALSLPLPRLDHHCLEHLERYKPVVVYCSHSESDLSSRAAWLLVSLGLSQVFRYTRGLADWLAHGLPIEGALSTGATAGSLARPGVPTCQLHDHLDQLQPILADDRWETCVVVTEDRVVLGWLNRRDLHGDPRATAQAIMQPGPPTVRPHVTLAQLAAAMPRSGKVSVLVTNSGGQLLGLLSRADVDAHLAQSAAGSLTSTGG